MLNLDTGDNQTDECEAWLRCLNRIPDKDHKYYLLLGCVDGEISYYSKGVAWTPEGETRVARLVNGVETIESCKSRGINCLVLESLEEFHMWGRKWGCHALIEADIWLEFSN